MKQQRNRKKKPIPSLKLVASTASEGGVPAIMQAAPVPESAPAEAPALSEDEMIASWSREDLEANYKGAYRIVQKLQRDLQDVARMAREGEAACVAKQEQLNASDAKRARQGDTIDAQAAQIAELKARLALFEGQQR